MVESDVRGCGGAYSRVGGVNELKHDAYFNSIYRLIPALLQDRPQNGPKPCGSAHCWKYCDYASGNGIGKLDVGFRAGRSHTWKPALGRFLTVAPVLSKPASSLVQAVKLQCRMTAYAHQTSSTDPLVLR